MQRALSNYCNHARDFLQQFKLQGPAVIGHQPSEVAGVHDLERALAARARRPGSLDRFRWLVPKPGILSGLRCRAAIECVPMLLQVGRDGSELLRQIRMLLQLSEVGDHLAPNGAPMFFAATLLDQGGHQGERPRQHGFSVT